MHFPISWRAGTALLAGLALAVQASTGPAALAAAHYPPASIHWPSGSSNLIAGHTLPNSQVNSCRPKSCANIFQPYHQKGYTQLGRVTGWYAARAFTPAQGKRSVLYFHESAYPSQKQARLAYTDESLTLARHRIDCYDPECNAMLDRQHGQPRLISIATSGNVVVEVMASMPAKNFSNKGVVLTIEQVLRGLVQLS